MLDSEQSVLTPTWLSRAAVWVAHCIMDASLWIALFSSRTPSPTTAFFPHISLGDGREAVLGHRQVCVTHTGPPQLAATLVTVFKRQPCFCHTGALTHPPELTPKARDSQLPAAIQVQRGLRFPRAACKPSVCPYAEPFSFKTSHSNCRVPLNKPANRQPELDLTLIFKPKGWTGRDEY